MPPLGLSGVDLGMHLPPFLGSSTGIMRCSLGAQPEKAGMRGRLARAGGAQGPAP